jgi:hypothetical protein
MCPGRPKASGPTSPLAAWSNDVEALVSGDEKQGEVVAFAR